MHVNKTACKEKCKAFTHKEWENYFYMQVFVSQHSLVIVGLKIFWKIIKNQEFCHKSAQLPNWTRLATNCRDTKNRENEARKAKWSIILICYQFSYKMHFVLNILTQQNVQRKSAYQRLRATIATQCQNPTMKHGESHSFFGGFLFVPIPPYLI